jgi:anti-anti-sigma factor
MFPTTPTPYVRGRSIDGDEKERTVPSSYEPEVLTSWIGQASGNGRAAWYQLGDQLWFRGQADPQDGWAGMELRGKLDAFDSDELIHAFSTLLEADVTSIDIDIGAISTLATSSARGLAFAANAAEARGGRLRVRNATDSVTTTLEAVGLGRLLLPPQPTRNTRAVDQASARLDRASSRRDLMSSFR